MPSGREPPPDERSRWGVTRLAVRPARRCHLPGGTAMRTRVLAPVLALLVSAACSASAATTDAAPAFAGPDELVYLATAEGPAAMDMRTGRVRVPGRGRRRAGRLVGAVPDRAPMAAARRCGRWIPATGADDRGRAAARARSRSVRWPATARRSRSWRRRLPAPIPWTPVPRTQDHDRRRRPLGRHRAARRFRLRGQPGARGVLERRRAPVRDPVPAARRRPRSTGSRRWSSRTATSIR